MATVYREDDGDLTLLRGRTLAVLGYGNQGHAHAQNLRDSLGPGDTRILVGARPDGESHRRAARDGFEVKPLGEAAAEADLVMILLPDEAQGPPLEREILPVLKEGATLAFGHGFSVAFRTFPVPEDRDVILVAPKGQGHSLRAAHVSGGGMASLLAVECDASGRAWETAKAYARAVGCLGAGGLATTFREEAITDLFGEQAVLCGGVPGLLKEAFEVMVDRGYQPEIAYIECLHELKLIVDLVHEGGLGYMRKLISPTAAWGGLTSGERVLGDGVRERLGAILDEIESGRFASEWLEEDRSGRRRLKERIAEEAALPVETVGAEVRARMPWLRAEKEGSERG
jgi:ketol-acid reductoisomerase